MKKATKILLNTTIACIITSVLLICIGKGSGGFVVTGSGADKIVIENNDREISVPATKSFKEIDVNVRLGSVSIESGPNYAIKIKYSEKGDKIDWQIRDDKLRIDLVNKAIDNRYERRICPEVTIFIPKGKRLNGISINGGMGSINMKELSAEKVKIDASQCSINLNEMNVGNLTISDSISGINIEKLSAEKVKIGASQCSIDVSGNITESIDIDNSMGSVELNLKRPENYYDCNLDCSMGNTEIKVNGQTCAEASDGQIINNNKAGKPLKIKNCMGNVKVNFES